MKGDRMLSVAATQKDIATDGITITERGRSDKAQLLKSGVE